MWWGRVVASCAFVVAAVTSVGGCASWTLAPSELDRAGQTVYTQVQVMRLVTDAALRERPATIALGVVLDDVATALAEQEEKIRGLSGTGERGAVLLELTYRARAELPPLRSSVDGQDRDGLRQVRHDLRPVAARLAELGLS